MHRIANTVYPDLTVFFPESRLVNRCRHITAWDSKELQRTSKPRGAARASSSHGPGSAALKVLMGLSKEKLLRGGSGFSDRLNTT